MPLALAHEHGATGQVVVTEPRRLAARLAATYVARHVGSQVGGFVGYSVRFEDRSSADTKVRYVTEGVLLRQLVRDPLLSGVSVVVLDELHERHVSTDTLLALLWRLRARRRDLHLVVMSASLDPKPVQQFLGECPHIHAPGKSFPLHINHADADDERPLSSKVQSAIRTALKAHHEGDVLVFLPGAAEIRQQQDLMQRAGHDVEVCPLHGDLPLDQQTKAITATSRRRVVLATNVAESSVTVDGVRIVVDSGVVKLARISPWSGRSMLRLEPISKNSALQRAGRAARQGPGHVYRVYSERAFNALAEHDAPEVERADLSGLLLDLTAMGVADPTHLAWLSVPPQPAVSAARRLLEALGAVTSAGDLTSIGRRMLSCPLPARLARVWVAALDLAISDDGALAVALLAERDIRRLDPNSADLPTEASDVTERMDRVLESAFGRQRTEPGVERSRVSAIKRVYEQLRRLAGRDRPRDFDASPEEREARLGRALLLGFGDRVARRKQEGSDELILKDGSFARLARTSVVRTAPLLLALDIDERQQQRGVPLVRLACAVEADWLLDAFPDQIGEEQELIFDPHKERVESLSRLTYGSVCLDESRLVAAPSDAASELLYAYALGKKHQWLGKQSGLESLRNRLLLLSSHFPELALPPAEAMADEALLRIACRGCVTFKELLECDWPYLILGELQAHQIRALNEYTPEHIQLRSDLSLPVHYERAKPPWIEARIQDFFGQSVTPTVVRGRVPLTLHLLAPNRRAVQVTNDLDGFWTRHYAEVRKELRRRYPKHHWPEDGRHAQPPAAGRLRPKVS